MATFAVGEIAIFWWPGSICHKCEMTVLSPLEYVEFMDMETGRMRTGWCHRIEGTFLHEPGVTYVSPPEHLRKRRPPQDWLKLCHLDETPLDVRAKTPEVA